MFTKLMFPPVNTYLLENSRSPKLSTIHYRGIAHDNDRPWLALGLVLCAHLAAFAALRPQTESLPVPPQPDTITISLISAPQPVAQPAPPKPAQPAAKPQPVVKKVVKTPPIVKQSTQPAPAPQAAEPVAMPAASAPVAAQQPSKSADSKPSAQQAYREPDFNAAYLNNPAPDYPPASQRLGEEGLVTLQVRVNENGKADAVELKTSSGSDRLDEAALEAVKKWRFVPAKRGDQPVSASVVVPVKFSLEG